MLTRKRTKPAQKGRLVPHNPSPCIGVGNCTPKSHVHLSLPHWCVFCSKCRSSSMQMYGCFGAQAPSGSDSLWFNSFRIETSGTLTSAQHRKLSLGYHPESLQGHFPQRFAEILPRPIWSQVDTSWDCHILILPSTLENLSDARWPHCARNKVTSHH